ncbi:hypothetical protein OG898_28145 [Streptomyces sp. NBC_00193]|uniref:hypothetical protein n=1 Tax=Streptomyces sp. NBC_00193 TaxID=2975675 RepID=UPI00224EA775|nr:hypothetical protein [Streptomyces sp. NBC_00193]MCX5300309.1 hypothetical protein [Streptomyces sp. NBC_00193]
MRLSRRERIALDGFLLAAGVTAVGWGAAHYGFDRTAHLAFALSLILVLVTAFRTVFHGLTLVRLPQPRIPASEEVRRHAARQAGIDPDA